MFFAQPVEVEPRPGYKIWVKYADGPEGEVDLSSLVGRGPYSAWNDLDFFNDVHIDSEMGVIAWSNDVDVSPDAIYLELTGLPFGQVFTWMQKPPTIGWMLEENESSDGAMPELVEVKPGEGYRVWLCYNDGVSGELDLSYLAGKGVFKSWADRAFFEQVSVGEGGEISWPNEIDIDPFKLYMDLTGKTVDDLFPGWGQGCKGDA